MTGNAQPFSFPLDPGPLLDGELALRLAKTTGRDQAAERVATYHFEMIVNGEVAGSIRFRAETDFDVETVAGHIGYNVAPEFRGRHLAERACRLILPLAAAHGFRALWITCNPDNLASRRTCERLGAEFVDTLGSKCRYRLHISQSDPRALPPVAPSAPNG